MKNLVLKNFLLKSFQFYFIKTEISIAMSKKSFKTFLLKISNYNPGTLSFFIFPIALYFGLFNGTKLKEIRDLTKINVPGVFYNYENISWDTMQKTSFLTLPFSSTNFRNFENISKMFLETLIFENSLNFVNYCNNFISFELKSNWKNKKKQFFLGTLPKKDKALVNDHFLIFPARENFQSNYYELLENKAYNLVQKKNYQLDEFPFKLEGSKQKKIGSLDFFRLKIENDVKDESLNNKKNSLIENTIPFINNKASQLNFKSNTLKKQTISFVKASQFHLKKSAIKLVAFSAVNTSQLKNQPQNCENDLIQPTFSSNDFDFNSQNEQIREFLNSHPRFENYQKWQKIQRQIHSFFYQKNYMSQFVPISNLNEIVDLLPSKTSIIASNQILNFLETFENKELLPHQKWTNRFRQMSGFEYPDLNQKNRLSLLINEEYFNFFNSFFQKKNSSHLKIDLVGNFNFSSLYLPLKTKPISLKMKYKPILYNLEGEGILYSGPGLTYNSEMDSYEAKNFKEVLENLQKQMDSNNPKNREFLAFFGNYNFYHLKNASKNSFDSSKLDQMTDKQTVINSLKRNLVEKDFSSDIFTYDDRFEICYLKDWKTWFSDNQTLSLENKNTNFINSFPVRQISTLQRDHLNDYFDVIEYQNEKEFLKKFTNKNIYFYEPEFVQSSMSAELVRKAFFNFSYNKKSSYYEFKKMLFNNSEQFLQTDTWEPINKNSWLFISQYLFALFIFYILKQFLQEYGRELISYLIDLISSLGIVDESFKDEFAPTNNSNFGYRVIKTTKKSFRDIAGIEHIFCELSEIVWFLRNSGRSFKIGNMLPKGILLVGLPGTGKTLLVKAIAGEAQVPVLVQSTSALNSFEGLGAQRLQNLFEKAKKLAPCIIFFDEIDSIGEKRTNILENSIGSIFNNFSEKKTNVNSGIPFSKKLSLPLEKNQKLENLEEQKDQNPQQNQETLSLLMQLLIELDGLKAKKHVVVIGATNRPESLDPALTRPGRFDKIFKLHFPGKTKRLEICKIYGTNLGMDPNIFWGSIANQTLGLSGADLAAIMNQSSIQAILNNSCHTMSTIEYGIEKVINSSSEIYSKLSNSNFSLNKNDPFAISRLAYYQCGRSILETATIANNIPPFSFGCSLIQKTKNTRYSKLKSEQDFKLCRRIELENKIVTLHGGKASEILFLVNSVYGFKKSKLDLWQSDLGSDDLKNATSLAYLMVDKWYFYSKNLVVPNLFNLAPNRNMFEILDPTILDFFSNFVYEIEIDSIEKQQSKYRSFQQWSIKPWWQIQVTKENDYFDSSSANWYRIYMYDPEENESNEEWAPPDQYYHNNQTYLLSRTIPFDDIARNNRDLMYQSILQKSFNNAFEMLNLNREFLDFFVQSVIEKEILREDDITKLGKFFV